MQTTELVRESIVIRVDFVRAGEGRELSGASGPAQIIDFAMARLLRAAVKEHVPARRPARPLGGMPGGYGDPF